MTDDRESISSADLGRIMSLVLDVADPRIGEDERDDAMEAAAEISVKAAYAVAAGYLKAVLRGVHETPELGPNATTELMERLAHMSVGTLGALAEEGDE